MDDFFTDLGDNLERYYQGFVDLVPRLGLGFVICILAWFVASRLHDFSSRRLKRRMSDPLLADFIARLIKATTWIVGLLFLLRVIGLGNVAGSVLAAAGVSAFIIGFALKDIGENFLAGIIMAFKRPFRIGDLIETGGVRGRVLSLNIRDTQLETNDGRDVYIPNGNILKNPLFNFTVDGVLRDDLTFTLPISVDYNSIRKIAREAVEQTEGVMMTGTKRVDTQIDISGTSILLSIFYWVDAGLSDMSAGKVRSLAIGKVLDALKQAGISF